MNSIPAIAGLTFRVAVRSRVLALLAVLIFASTICLPFVMKDDGTPAGMVQLYLRYALGWSVLLISMTALWTGAGAFSQEVEARQIHLVKTKPVRSFHLWVGKWAGLMLVNAVLLGFAGALAYGMLAWTARPSLFSGPDQIALREEILVARQAIAAEPDPELLPSPEVGGHHGIRVGTGPGGELRWSFTAPDGLRAGDCVLLQYDFASSRLADTAPFEMLWMAGPEDDPERHTVRESSAAGISHSIRIPAEIFGPGRIAKITFRNIEVERPAYILFSAENGVRILVREGGFEMNYARALLVLYARLAFFSALGLAAGALFSFPVAAFISLVFLFMTGFSRFMGTIAAAGPGALQEQIGANVAPFWDSLIRHAFAAVIFIMPPLWQYDPFDAIASGGLVSWRHVASAFLVLAGAYSAAPALLSGWLFSRRELGLPS